jgi:thymidylate synthase (FAD)
MEEVNALNGKNLILDKLLDGSGFVKVVKVSPETHPEGYTPEYLAAKAARLSYGSDNKSASADKSLIEYLVRHKHTSPLEMCSITFCMKMPLAICRQLLRHRTGKFNEFSQRYTEVPEEDGRFKLNNTFTSFRKKSKLNKQSSELITDENTVFSINETLEKMEEKQDEVFKLYKELLDKGLAKELARFYLPLSTYTTIYVQFDLNNLMKFLQLRCAEDAQFEIQVYANAMRELASQFFPICMGMFNQYRDGIYLGKYEKKMIKEKRIPDEVTSKSLRASLTQLAEELSITLKD